MAEQITDPTILAHLNGAAQQQPINDPEVLAALNADMHPDDAGIMHSIRSALHTVDPYVRSIANGMTLGLADRFAAGMGAVTGVGGKEGDYAGNLKDEQARTDEFAKDHPVADAVAQTGGALATLPLTPAARALEGATLGAKALTGAGIGAGIGGAQGAFSSKDLTDLPQTARNAAVGTVAGSLIGGAVPLAGRGIGNAATWIGDALRITPGISRSAATHLLSAVQADGARTINAALDRLGPEAMLADTGPAMLGKAQGAALNSDEGRSVLQGALNRRNEGTNARIQGDVNAALGPAEDPQTVTNAIRARRSEVDNKAYPAALDNAPPVDTAPILRQLDAMIPRSVGMERRALENIREMISSPAEKTAAVAPAAASSPTTASPANSLAADVAAIREKYGNAAATAYLRQQQGNAAAAKPGAQSMLEFLASKGGLGPDAEFEAIGAHSHTVNVEGVGRRKLVKQGGLPLDYAREAAEEAGYLRGANGTSTPREFLDAIDAEMRGQKRYPEGFEGAVSKREAAAMSEREQAEFDRHMQGFHDDLDAAGYSGIGKEVRDRAVKLMAREAMAADDAVERAARSAADFPGDRPMVSAPATPQQKAGQASRVPKDDATLLHKIKQEIDNVINYDAPGLGVPAGALQRQQGALKVMRQQLNKALEKQVPGYAAANRTSEALAKRAEAVEAGTQYLGSGKTTPSPDRFAADFEPLSQGEKIALAKGSRGNIERVLGTKANDLQALRGELQGEGGWNTAKIATVHGQDAANQLMGSVERNLKFRDTHNKVVENSQTAQRQAAQRSMKPDPSSETPLVNPNMTATGLAGTALKKTLVGITNALLRSDPTKSYGEVAKILSAQGPAARAYLKALSETLERRAALAPKLDRLANRSSAAAALTGGHYLADLSGGRSEK